MPHRAIWRSTWVSQEVEGEENMGMGLYCVWNTLGRLWGVGSISRCLVPGPGMIRVQGDYPLEYKSQVEEVAESMGSGLLCSPLLSPGLPWEGHSLPSQQVPRYQNIKNTENKKRYLIQVCLGHGRSLR